MSGQDKRKTRKAKGKRYIIHDNGNHPFFVNVSGSKVVVEKNMDVYDFKQDKIIKHPPQEILRFTAKKVFLGKQSPYSYFDEFDPKEDIGNNILCQVGSQYILISDEIYQFAPVAGDTIKIFYSDIGLNDVPYPYAIGDKYIYMLTDKVAVEKSFFDMHDDLYKQFYTASTYMPMCLKGGPAHKELCKDKEKAKQYVKELETKQKKLKTKVLQERLVPIK